jgi:hypothetical protein
MLICVTVVQVCDARDDDSSNAAGDITHPNSLKKFVFLNSPLQGGEEPSTQLGFARRENELKHFILYL